MGQKWVGFLYFIHHISLLFQLVVLCSARVRGSSWAGAALVTAHALPVWCVQQANPCVGDFISDLIYNWLNSVPYPHCDSEAWCAAEVPQSLFPCAHPWLQDTPVCVGGNELMHQQRFTAIRFHTDTALSGDWDFPHSSQHFNSTWSQLRPLCTFAALAPSCLDWTTINSKVLYVF